MAGPPKAVGRFGGGSHTEMYASGVAATADQADRGQPGTMAADLDDRIAAVPRGARLRSEASMETALQSLDAYPSVAYVWEVRSIEATAWRSEFRQ